MLKVTSPSFLPLLSGHRRTAFMTLSNQSITAAASVGTVIGDFSIINGSTRTYTYTLTSNPGGLFSVSGSTLSVAAGLSSGVDPITVRASDTGTSVVTGAFAITVTSTAAGTNPSMQFNNTTNSQYIPLMGGLG